MKIAVVGSRGFDDYYLLKDVLSGFSITEIISGGAKGADSLGAKYADENNIPLKEFIPDWKKYGRGAGMIRNKSIIENCEYCIAFWDGKSRGTKNSISLAKKLNKGLKIVKY